MNHDDNHKPEIWSCGTCPWWERHKRDSEGFEFLPRLNPRSTGHYVDRGSCTGSTPPFAPTYQHERCAVHPDAPKVGAHWLRRVAGELLRREIRATPCGGAYAKVQVGWPDGNDGHWVRECRRCGHRRQEKYKKREYFYAGELPGGVAVACEELVQPEVAARASSVHTRE